MASKNDKKAQPIKINPLKLIKLVRCHEVLYNSLYPGYNDKISKDLIWEQIIVGLFPLFDTYSASTRETIRIGVRRRWKTLRDSVSREIKKSVTLENYSRKKGSSIVSELEFLIPHIRSTHCAKFADELGLQKSYSNSKSNIAEPQEEEEDSYINNHNNDTNYSNDDSFHNLIDLTEECDLKPFIKQDTFAYDDMENGDNLPPFSPQVQMDIGEGEADINNIGTAQTTVDTDDANKFCTVAEFKGGEFINPTDLCADQQDEEVELGSTEMEKEAELEKSLDTAEPNSKRARSMPSIHDLQTKILQLLSSIESRDRSEHEANDEDRMFLLSLVSDLKRVPDDKKMRIKMEIVTAIARGNQ